MPCFALLHYALLLLRIEHWAGWMLQSLLEIDFSYFFLSIFLHLKLFIFQTVPRPRRLVVYNIIIFVYFFLLHYFAIVVVVVVM